MGDNEKNMAKAMMFDYAMKEFIKSRNNITKEFENFRKAGGIAAMSGSRDPSELLKDLSNFMTQEHLILFELIRHTEEAEEKIKEF